MTRKSFLYLLIAAVLCSFSISAAYAQRNPAARDARIERVHAAKVAYLTDRLRLSSDQAEKFWPVYNQYEDEMHALRQENRQAHRDGNQTDAEAKQAIDDNLDKQEQVLQLRRKYNERFLQIISAGQVAELYEAERDFKQLLLQRLKERRGGGDDAPPPRGGRMR